MRPEATAAWRRLEFPGHDAARLSRDGDGWRLTGAGASFTDAGPTALVYEVLCAADWTCRAARIHGFAGERTVDWRIQRSDGGWAFDGAPVPAVAHCVDLDFGFTPATNVTQIRRIALADGGRAQFDVAWLDVGSGALTALPQVYERRSATAYAYEAPTFGYTAVLQLLAPEGFVRTYPDLWEAEG